MRIAVDARPLSAPLTGIGRYTRALLTRMLPSPEHDWFLYSDRPITDQTQVIESTPTKIGTSKGGGPGSLRWAQIEYPRWAKQDSIDVFWSPRHHLPLMMNHEVSQVVTIHDLVWQRYPETMQWKNLWLERLLMPASIKRADRVICVSHFTASEVAYFYPDAISKTTVVHEAAEEPASKTEDHAGTDTPYMLFVGTLEPRKNLNRLLHAIHEAKKETKLPPLFIAGGVGWGNIDIYDEIKRLGLKDHVKVLGYVSDLQLQALYANARCLLMPSLYEGFGLPALEAMQYGVPVIASTAGSLPEVVGNAGILADPTSAASIAQAMIDLFEDSATYSRLKERSLEQSNRFSWDIAARETLSVLEDAYTSKTNH